MAETTFIGASEVAKLSNSRVFEISDELAAEALLDWSPLVQVRLERVDGGDDTYNLVVRRADPCVFESRESRDSGGALVAWCTTHLCVHTVGE